MQSFGSDFDDLVDLIGQLRDAGYQITTEQCISVQNLLVALAAYDGFDHVVKRLSTYLAPILCISPDEQRNFDNTFRRWQARRAQFQATSPFMKPPKDEKNNLDRRASPSRWFNSISIKLRI